MHREIGTIPDVIASQLADPGGHVRELADWLAGRGIEHLYLTGCGDSAFAGLAATLAFRRHSRLRVHAVHALDLARYLVRYLPPASAVMAISFSGKVGRTNEAARQAAAFGYPVIALTGHADGPLARTCDRILPIDVPTLGFSPGSRGTHTGDALHAHRPGAGRHRDPGGRARDPGRVRAAAGPGGQDARLVRRTWRPTSRRGRCRAGSSRSSARGRTRPRRGSAPRNSSRRPSRLPPRTWRNGRTKYFITRPADPVVVIAPSGAARDRAWEILSELQFVRADATVVSDVEPPGRAGHLRLPTGTPEELSPVLAALPLAQLGFHLARQAGSAATTSPARRPGKSTTTPSTARPSGSRHDGPGAARRRPG